jgi:nucleoside phosphorylase
MPSPLLAIVTALKQEQAAVRAALPNAERDGILIERCGVGPRSAERFVRALLESTPSLKAICSSGVCGALSPKLNVGDWVLPHALLGHSSTGVTPLYDIPIKHLEFQGLNITLDGGILVSTDQVVCTARDKAALALQSGASAVDMETYGMLTAVDRRIPVFALRTVSDIASENLPPEIATFLTEEGKLKIATVAKFVLTQPHRVGALMKLGKHTNLACKALTEAWRTAGPMVLENIR